MENENNIRNELLDIAPVVHSAGKHNVYEAPEGYFNDLTGEVMLLIKRPYLVEQTFTVDANYFDTLASSIIQKIKAADKKESEVFTELEEVAPLLNTFSKNNLYAVPGNYFQDLSVKIPVNQAKIVSFQAKRRWYAYSAAAILAGIILLGGLWYKGDSSKNPGAVVNLAHTDVQKEISTVGEEEIINYLDHQPVTADITSASYQEPDPDINESIHNMSNEELQQYLKENVEPNEKDFEGI